MIVTVPTFVVSPLYVNVKSVFSTRSAFVLASLTAIGFTCGLPSYSESLGSVASIPVFFSSGVSGPSGTIDLGLIVKDPSFTTNVTVL